ncbi:MAG: hypothetical protein RIS94_726 [Pseudomonadota bacterium]|jgi:membrane protease YdiL (CAAX protease family)
MITPLREFAAYLAHPVPRQPAGLADPASRRVWSAMLVLHLGVLLLALAPLLKLWQAAMGLPSPDAFGKVPPALLLPLVTVIAPVGEEVAFRGWLTGRPRAIWLLLCGIIAALLLTLVSNHVAETAASLGFVATAVAALGGWIALRHRKGAPVWFFRAYPLLFWLSVGSFGLSHLVNYPAFSLALLPMVLPQLWTGMVLGFVRMRVGLPGSMLVHGIANGAAVGLVILLSH